MPSTSIRTGFCASLLLGLLAACSDSSDRRSSMPPPELVEPAEAADRIGPFAVGHRREQVFDASRGNRHLPYDVWYPAEFAPAEELPRTVYPLFGPIALRAELAVDDLPVSRGGPYPLLLFSHGFGGINIQSTRLMEALASHGFVVVSPEHTGNTSDNLSDSHREAGARRVPDISFMIDTFLARNETPGDDFFERLDPGLIGIAGHSFGGGTALGSLAGFFGQPRDERVGAALAISVEVADRFTDTALAMVQEPVLFLGGTEDTAVPISHHDYGFDALTGSEAVYQVDIIGAGHNHFAVICDIGNTLIANGLGQDSWPTIGATALLAPYADACSETAFPIEVAQGIQNTYAVAFFRRHLGGETGYDYYLRAQYAKEHQPDVGFRMKLRD